MVTQKKTITFKPPAVFCAALILGLVIAFGAMAAPTEDKYLLRVEVKDPGEEIIAISAPVSLLQTVFSALPEEIRVRAEKAGFIPDVIVKELETLEGQDIVNITGDETIRIWLDPVDRKNRKDLGFLKIHIEEPKEDGTGEVINVCVPRGLVEIAGGLVKEFKLTEGVIELPPFLQAETCPQACTETETTEG